MPTGKRAPGQKTITISLSKEMVDELDAWAAEENRTRSNLVVTELGKALRARKSQKKIAVLRHVGAVEEESFSPTAKVAEEPPAPPAKGGGRGRKPSHGSGSASPSSSVRY